MDHKKSLTAVFAAVPLYVFSGYITNRVLDGIAAGIEDVLPRLPETERSYRKVFGVFVEMAQNIIFYSSDRVTLDNDEAGFGTLAILRDEGAIKITASNEVQPIQMEKLNDVFGKMIGKTAEEITVLYKQRMMETFDDPTSRGGGLGYLDIARKSVKPLDFGFETSDNGKIVFHVTAWI